MTLSILSDLLTFISWSDLGTNLERIRVPKPLAAHGAAIGVDIIVYPSMPLKIGSIGEAGAAVGALERLVPGVQYAVFLHRLQLVEFCPADIA